MVEKNDRILVLQGSINHSFLSRNFTNLISLNPKISLQLTANKLLKRLFSGKSQKLIARKIVNSLIGYAGLDSRDIYYDSIGVLKFQEPESGESWFIKTVLVEIMRDLKHPIFLDIGANVGDYGLFIANTFPHGQCYCVEPNPKTFQTLKFRLSKCTNITPLNLGIGSQAEERNLYFYDHDQESGHASLYPDVLTDLHHASNLSSTPCKIETIDRLLAEQKIPEQTIDFIKIDTEGHELDGLKGGIKTLATNKIRAIQFEFNEMNVVSRVYLKDFYGLLSPAYKFFRLDTNRLIPLRWYNPANEIFNFQNIIAVRADIADRLFGLFT